MAQNGLTRREAEVYRRCVKCRCSNTCRKRADEVTKLNAPHERRASVSTRHLFIRTEQPQGFQDLQISVELE
jgi:hypothetical protein